ncbi:phosphoribosylanthranilate isomerase [Mameliella alba]|uniref:phosphoribosylanthranilate isomerase n=1 Tax=Mameliella alba TaxID=561184 RepID=UPI00088A314B|nr:phosphoribosylanthranilate isomerase [Mameliella alba]OWV46695.1 phosphoribosylanthranilate isomerase [Mameliella alba]PTR37603.1 phosphoribosylanthranilate isomerase [Mameliella alba]GGF49481.1 N-(5'-phosphoribosyl)anthranilate isomerase [Mameliella alba]SDD66890.1 phosphoribosylanthranilate isomerase [Mameliella alba]
MADVRVKICGLTRPGDMEMVAGAGASYAGLVFFGKSPRNVTPEVARDLALEAPVGLAKVGLMVNPTDEFLDEVMRLVPLDMVQLHGAETPERVVEVRARWGLPVMKAVGVGAAEDLEKLAVYQKVADQILVDAKPPKGADLPGGNGLAFDWKLIAGRRWSRPWMLAGGLTPENVGLAVAMTGTAQVDVSSGVESAPGIKDAGKVRAFVEAAKGAEAAPRL